MTPNPADRTALFIDGANLYASAKALNTDLDFRKLSAVYGVEELPVHLYGARDRVTV